MKFNSIILKNNLHNHIKLKMASAPDSSGNFFTQDNDFNDEEMINIDDIEKEKEKVSKKDFMILKILNQKDNKTLVLWSNNTQSWINSEDVSDYSYTNQREISTHNTQVQLNVRNNPASTLSPRRAFIYGRVSEKKKLNHQQHTSMESGQAPSTTMDKAPSSSGSPPSYSQSMNYQFSDSIETQKEFCYKYCLNNNIIVDYAAYDEGVSGRNMKNLNYELGSWCPYLKSGQHMLVVYTPDRLGRNVERVQSFLNTMIDKNIDVYFVKENILWNKDIPSEKKRVIQHILIDAEYISNQTSERIKNTISRKKAQGHKLGKPPFGFKAYRDKKGVRKFKVCAKEDLIIKEILKKDKFMIMNDEKETKISRHLKIKHHIKKVYKRELTVHMIKNIIKKYNLLDIQAKKKITKDINFINKKMLSLFVEADNPFKASDFYSNIDEDLMDESDTPNEEFTLVKQPIKKSKETGLIDKTMSFLNNMKYNIFG